jgi:hypothetical protein
MYLKMEYKVIYIIYGHNYNRLVGDRPLRICPPEAGRTS